MQSYYDSNYYRGNQDQRFVGPLLPVIGGFLLAELLPPIFPTNYYNQYVPYQYIGNPYQYPTSYPYGGNTTFNQNTYQLSSQDYQSYTQYPYYKSNQNYY